jgi:hypothetical protein
MAQPQREWFIRCYDEEDGPVVCGIEANHGMLDLVTPDERVLRFPPEAGAELLRAVSEAMAVTERDVTEPGGHAR